MITNIEDMEPGAVPHPSLLATPTGPQDGSVDDEFAGFDDYFGFNETHPVYLPDKKQYVTVKRLTEGDRRKFLRETRQDARFNQRTGEAIMALDQGAERMALLVHSIVGWKLVRRTSKGREWVPFSKGSPGAELERWIEQADPAVIAHIEKEIRKLNPWLLSEMSVEEIDKEITHLQELREIAVKREAEGKDS